jgi:hypothetical protein
MKSTLVALVVAGTALAGPGEWRVGKSAVRVICPMTVGGSFDVKTAALSRSVTASHSRHGLSTVGRWQYDVAPRAPNVSVRAFIERTLRAVPL